MGSGMRYNSKIILTGLMMTTALVLFAPKPAFAQFCDVPAVPAINTPVIGAINTQTTTLIAADNDVVDAVDANVDLDIEDVDFTIETGDTEIVAALAGLDADLQVLFGSLAGTTTNNATMQAGTDAKAHDYDSSTKYTQEMQAKQADEQKEFAAGNLQFMNGNLCGVTTLASGMSAVSNAVATERASYNAYRSGSNQPTTAGAAAATSPLCSTCGTGMNPSPAPPAAPAAEFTNKPQSAMMRNVAKAASAFGGATDCASTSDQPNASNTDGGSYKDPSTGTAATDTTQATHLDVDANLLQMTPVYTDLFVLAHDQFASYIGGLPPEIPSNAPSFCKNHAVSDPAILGHNEKLAFYNLSNEALLLERSEHTPVNSGAGNAVSQIFTAAGFSEQTVQAVGGGGKQTSKAQMDDAIYRQAAEDPNFLANTSTMNNNRLLGFIAGEILELNHLEYDRYLIEKEQFKVQSASLNLQARSFNFQASP